MLYLEGYRKHRILKWVFSTVLETLSKRLNALHEVSKKSKDEFKKLLDNYIQSQAAIEEEVNAIQEGINSLTDAMNKKKGLK